MEESCCCCWKFVVCVLLVFVSVLGVGGGTSEEEGVCFGEEGTVGCDETSKRPRQEHDMESPFKLVHPLCRVWVAEHYFSDSEVDGLADLVKQSGGWVYAKGEGKTFQVPSSIYTDEWQPLVRSSDLMYTLETRIARDTGIPMHSREDMGTLARMLPGANNPLDGYFPNWGLHHETHERPHRSRTVIVYMNDVDEGGRTIFPLCPMPGASEGAEQLRRSMYDALTTSTIFGDRTTNYHRMVEFDKHSEHPLNIALSLSCKGMFGLSMKPKKGLAVMFDSLLPSGQPNLLTWHGGCNVVRGEKLLFQKFKENPRDGLLDDDGDTYISPTPYNPFIMEDDGS